MLKGIILKAFARAADAIAKKAAALSEKAEQRGTADPSQTEASEQYHVGEFNPPIAHPQLILKREKVSHMNEMYTVVAGYDRDAFMRSVVIPDGVVGIERDCFKKCIELEEVYIPDSVNFMDGNTFEGCSSLTKVRLSPALTEIPFWGFRECKSLKEIELPKKLKRIGFCAFWQSGLESVVIPEGVETIQLSAFSLCYKLASVSLPSTLREIEDSAFESSKSLTSLKLPKGLRSLGERTFWHSALAGVEIPPKLTELKNRTFRDCVNLRTIYVPNNIGTIGSEVFMGCKSLESARIPLRTYIDATVFEGCEALGTLTVGEIAVDIPMPKKIVNIGRLAFFIARCIRVGKFEADPETAGLILEGNLTDTAFQLAQYGITGAWEYVAADLNRALVHMILLDRPQAFDALVERGAWLSRELTERYIEEAVKLEQKELYLSLIRYKRDVLGYDTGDTADGRFSL